MTRIFHRLFLRKWIPCQALTSVLCLLFLPKTVHCSTKNAYTSKITFLALVPWQKVCKVSIFFKIIPSLKKSQAIPLNFYQEEIFIPINTKIFS